MIVGSSASPGTHNLSNRTIVLNDWKSSTTIQSRLPGMSHTHPLFLSASERWSVYCRCLRNLTKFKRAPLSISCQSAEITRSACGRSALWKFNGKFINSTITSENGTKYIGSCDKCHQNSILEPPCCGELCRQPYQCTKCSTEVFEACERCVRRVHLHCIISDPSLCDSERCCLDGAPYCSSGCEENDHYKRCH